MYMPVIFKTLDECINIIKCLSTEVLFIRVIIYFGGLHQSKALYKFGFFEGIFEGFQNKAECNTYK